jgi:hypothetical protein
MRPDDLRALLRRQPLPLLRLHLTDGTTFAITHPDMAAVTRSIVQIPLPTTPSGERKANISLVHIVWVEVIAPTP